MHILDVTAAVRELARVTARGGCLVISENTTQVKNSTVLPVAPCVHRSTSEYARSLAM